VLYGTGRGFDVTDPQRLAVAAPAVPRCADTEPGLGLPVAARDLTGDGVSDLLVGVYGGHRSCLGSAYLEVTGGHSGLVSSSTFLRFPLARLYPDLGLDSSSVG
jgi:hypothetical protein